MASGTKKYYGQLGWDEAGVRLSFSTFTTRLSDRVEFFYWSNAQAEKLVDETTVRKRKSPIVRQHYWAWVQVNEELPGPPDHADVLADNSV